MCLKEEEEEVEVRYGGVRVRGGYLGDDWFILWEINYGEKQII
jgi:hypothetical protein